MNTTYITLINTIKKMKRNSFFKSKGFITIIDFPYNKVKGRLMDMIGATISIGGKDFTISKDFAMWVGVAANYYSRSSCFVNTNEALIILNDIERKGLELNVKKV